MNRLTLGHLKLGLDDLFAKREHALHASATGKLYDPMLRAIKSELDALPAALTGGAPLANQLAEADGIHDGFGGALFHLTHVYTLLPDVSPEVREAAARVRATFIPSLKDLKASYSDEAAAATTHRPALQAHKADLQALPFAGKHTALDIATKFVDAGDTLKVLLSDRADAPGAVRSGAGTLRSRGVGLLNRMRDALGDEIAHHTKLPRDLDASVFNFFDQLEAQAAASAASASAPATAAPATDAAANATTPAKPA